MTAQGRIPELRVALDYAIHLLSETDFVTVCPDGQQLKNFDLVAYLKQRDFARRSAIGRTTYGGVYHRGIKRLAIDPSSGNGDVWTAGLVAECKGAARKNDWGRTRVGVYEIVGKLMSLPVGPRHVAVLPRTDFTQRLTAALLPRCSSAGIEFALVDDEGRVEYLGIPRKRPRRSTNE